MKKETQLFFQNYIAHYDEKMQYPSGNFLNFKQLFHPQLQNEPSKQKVSAVFMIMGIQQEVLEPFFEQNLQTALIFRQQSDFPEDSKPINEKINIVQIEKYKESKNSNKKFMQIFHPKIYMFKFKNFLRILIGTPNLCIGDWAVFNQVFYLRDFKLKKKNQDSNNASKFCQDLIYFLKSSLQQEFELLKEFSKIDLDDYDIEQDDSLKLVWSLPGINFRGQYRTSGLLHFEQIIKNNKPQTIFTKENALLTYCTSSLGKIDIDFLRNLLLYIIPDMQDQGQLQEEDLQKMVRIIYPDKEMMEKNSKLSQIFGTCLFNKKTNQNCQDSVDNIYYKCEKKKKYKSNKIELFPHLKFFVVQNNKEINDDSIIYFGSHNCTSGAWGRVYGGTKVYNYNTELGIIMVPKKGSKNQKQKFIDNMIVEIHDAKRYRENDELYNNSLQIIFSVQIANIVCQVFLIIVKICLYKTIIIC